MAHLLAQSPHRHSSLLSLAVLLLHLFLMPSCTADCNAPYRFRDQILKASQVPAMENWNDKNCCNWVGIVCKNNVLERMNLSNFGLEGAIPSVSELTELVSLDLSHNNFTGDLPQGLSSLTQLQHLDLSHNSLGGRLMSADPFKMPSLVSLSIAGNAFEGSIPLPGTNSTSLQLLDLSFNKFIGWQWELCKLSGLKNLIIRNNLLGSGGNVLPQILSNLAWCQNLEVLDISNNGFTGSFPTSVGSLPPNLRTLDMGNTSVSGEIPVSIANLSNLERLILDHNQLTGGLNEVLPSLRKLQELDVSYNDLSGGIPDNLSNCAALQALHLQHNHFSGTIPGFLGTMTNLTFLDVSSNNLTGRIPEGEIFKNNGTFLCSGNKLCGGSAALQLLPCPGDAGSPPGQSGDSPPGQPEGPPMGKNRSAFPKVALAFIIIIAISFLLLILFWLSYKRNHIPNKHFEGFVKGIAFLNAPLRVAFCDLQEATKGFSPAYRIGSGGIGSVYRGFLEREKKEVAVKVLQEVASGDSRSFLEACSSIRMFAHRNLVKMVASCMNADTEGNQFQALVFEFMPYGNLEMWLHEEVVSQAMSFKKWNLNLYQRLGIAIDVASVFSYLHCDFETPVVHCNLKPSNILIADDMTAHVTDLGMNKFFDVGMIIRNSAGYVAPELSTRSPVSPTWDVYSFGVILLEMFTGKRPTDEDFGGAFSLQRYVHQGCCSSNLEEIVDPLLLSEESGGKLTERSRECIISILNTALNCSNESPGDRMDIKEAFERLVEAKAVFLNAGGNGDMSHTTYDREESPENMRNMFSA